MEGFEKYGTWIYIDPDEQTVECIEEIIELDTLCELLRCDATDLLPLGDNFLGFIDGEGAWQERQTEWEFDGKPCWGPMLIFIMGEDELDMISCTEEDLETIELRVRFPESPDEILSLDSRHLKRFSIHEQGLSSPRRS